MDEVRFLSLLRGRHRHSRPPRYVSLQKRSEQDRILGEDHSNLDEGSTIAALRDVKCGISAGAVAPAVQHLPLIFNPYKQS